MAKFIIEYEVNLGDRVWFTVNGEKRLGTVQDVSQMPDVFIEGFDQGEYKRWRVGVDSIEGLDVTIQSSRVEIETQEPVEFVHVGNVGTPEWNNKMYRTFGSYDFKVM